MRPFSTGCKDINLVYCTVVHVPSRCIRMFCILSTHGRKWRKTISYTKLISNLHSSIFTVSSIGYSILECLYFLQSFYSPILNALWGRNESDRSMALRCVCSFKLTSVYREYLKNTLHDGNNIPTHNSMWLGYPGWVIRALWQTHLWTDDRCIWWQNSHASTSARSSALPEMDSPFGEPWKPRDGVWDGHLPLYNLARWWTQQFRGHHCTECRTCELHSFEGWLSQIKESCQAKTVELCTSNSHTLTKACATWVSRFRRFMRDCVFESSIRYTLRARMLCPNN